MASLNLVDAFAKYGAKAGVRAQSAVAADGAIVLNCASSYFGHHAEGVLRYQDRLSREKETARRTVQLGEHLTRALDESLPVRPVIVSRTALRGGKSSRTVHVRADLVGKVTSFDGDLFIVDFRRIPEPETEKKPAGKRR
jgi:hypothetical protein